jgi:hypothetical protein
MNLKSKWKRRKQFLGLEITLKLIVFLDCWVPAQFKASYEKYADSYCWIAGKINTSILDYS